MDAKGKQRNGEKKAVTERDVRVGDGKKANDGKKGG